MTKEDRNIDIPQDIIQKWQSCLDILVKIIEVPAALIMRIDDPDIEVFVSSNGNGRSPYHVGDREHLWNSGLYCETVIRTKERLLVSNALTDKEWKNNPDVMLNMVSYLGFPILLPDGKPFGTICILDNKENPYDKSFEQMMLKFKELIEGHLELLLINQVLGDKNKKFSDYLTEIQTLRGINSICMHCKKIKDDKDQWNPVEKYLYNHPKAEFSHGCCPKCLKKYYPDALEDSKS